MEEQKSGIEQEQSQAVISLSQNPVEQQPQKGDCVGHCAHISEGQPVWYLCEKTPYSDFQMRVSGTLDWLCICVECEAKLKSDIKANVITGVGHLELEPQMHLKPVVPAPPDSEVQG